MLFSDVICKQSRQTAQHTPGHTAAHATRAVVGGNWLFSPTGLAGGCGSGAPACLDGYYGGFLFDCFVYNKYR
jgi:hypothetical protein